ncbi:hypothetical protein, partial [Bacillus toyonensis]|uniref:hypothetical protein n=1 Tax=Bacillus toyonensis TaxID=155322 RepID=UPI0035E26F91
QYAPALQQVETQGAIDRAAGTAQVEVDAERQKKNQTIMRDARETLSLLDQAESLLNTASGGSAQAARDSVLGAFNVSTEGAKATAGLNVLAAKLVGKVPRFEGPQSDKDVMLYRQAAGDLANPQLPVGTRMAALQPMRDLNTSYATSPQLGAPQQPQPGQREQGAAIRIQSAADYNALPSGALFIAPDGTQRRKR